MTVILGVMAGILFVMYSFYAVRIIRGNPQVFELELLKSFAAWIIARGAGAKMQIWLMIAVSIMVEISYFFLVIITITNPVMLVFSGFFAGFEFIHLILVSQTFSRFFQGKLLLKDVFNWKVERISALLFFTHSFLVIFCLVITRIQ